MIVSKHYVIVLKENDPVGYFESEDISGSGNVVSEVSNSNTNVNREEIDDLIFPPTGNQTKDIAHVRYQGLEVDDNTKLAPEIFLKIHL